MSLELNAAINLETRPNKCSSEVGYGSGRAFNVRHWTTFAMDSIGLAVVLACYFVVATVEFIVWAFTRRSLCDE